MANPWERDWSEPAQQQPSRSGAVALTPPSRTRAAEERRKDEGQRLQREANQRAWEAEERARSADARAAAAEARNAEKVERDNQTLDARGGVETTEGERKAAFLATRVAAGIRKLEEIGGGSPSYFESIVEDSKLGNAAIDEQRQRIRDAQLDILDAALTLGTGAAYTKEQLEGYRKSYFPAPFDKPGNVSDKKERLRVLMEAARVGSGAANGLIDEALSRSYGQSIMGSNPDQNIKSGGGGSMILPDPRQQAEIDAYLAANPRGSLDPAAFNQFISASNDKYGRQQGDYSEFIAGYNDPNALVDTQLKPVNVEGNGLQEFIGGALDNSLGAGALAYGNAALGGIPGLFADENETNAMRQEYGGSMLAGDVAGAITGTLAAGGLLGRAAGQFANPSVQSFLRNPMASDTAYSAVMGATSSDNPWLGALGGAAAGAVGSKAGDLLWRGVNRLRGRETGGLSRGEDAILNALGGNRDTAVNSLQQGVDLGVPLSLSDVSRPVNSLAGAAIRRNPEAADPIIQALTQRSRGQYDRMTGAIERDLGPVTNIPQRSEDLIQQARAQAGPLYDAAYNAPGAGAAFPQIEDLLARPSASNALGRATRIAAEEGRDPLSLGFDLGVDNIPTLNQVPSWETLDYLKRGLDDVLESYPRNSVTGRLELDAEGRAVDQTRRELLKRIDVLNQDYAAARSAYAGPAAEREALISGQQALNVSPNQLSVDVANMTPQRLGQAQLGFQSQLAENAGRVRNNSNPFTQLDTPNMAERLGVMYPDNAEGIARLLAQRDLEGQAAASVNRLYGNSLSAERLAADQAFNGNNIAGDIATGAIETAATGAPIVTALRSGFGQKVGDAMRLGFGRNAEKMAEEILPIAGNTNTTDVIAQLLLMGERYDAAQAINELRRQNAARVGSAVGTGLTAGALPSL